MYLSGISKQKQKHGIREPQVLGVRETSNSTFEIQSHNQKEEIEEMKEHIQMIVKMLKP